MKSQTASTSCIGTRLLACVLACAVVLLQVSPAWAEPPGVQPLEKDGEPGLWFPETIARRVLADVEELRVRRAEVDLCRKRAELHTERVAALDKALTESKRATATARGELDRAIRGREEAERERDGWFAGKPWFWGVVGVAVGAVATGFIISYARD